MGIKTDLRDELTNEIIELSKVEFGSEKYKVGVDGVVKITDRLIELDRVALEEDKIMLEEKKLEADARRDEIEAKDRKSKNRISWANIGVPAFITGLGAIAMFVYEERGTIVGQASRKIVDRIFRMK